jgi:thioredoxin-related protein
LQDLLNCGYEILSGMYKELFVILFLWFPFCELHAQEDNEFSRQFNKSSSFKLLNVSQRKTSGIGSDDKSLSLFVFLSPECPLCQNYSKTLRELTTEFREQVNLYGIFPGNAYTLKEVLAFENKYKTGFNLFIDQKKQLTKYLQAVATPQAILLDNTGNLLYTGAIDDWVLGLGKTKIKPSNNYLQDAIEQSLRSGEVKIRKTKAFGCKINDY